MKCLSCEIVWADPKNKYTKDVCPFCKAELPKFYVEHKIHISNGFDILENGVLFRYLGEGGDIVVPEGVVEIGYGAFAYCRNLTSINIPDSVSKISSWAFYGCSGLLSVELPKSLTSIEDCAFMRCESLPNLTIEPTIILGNRVFE